LIFFSQTIFDKAGTGLSASACTIVVGVVMTVASLGVPYLVEKMGRRLSIFMSALIMGISLVQYNF